MIEIKRAVTGFIQTNTYVVICGGEAVIIDAEAKPKQLETLISGCKVKGVILTHAHFDHIRGLKEIIKTYNTKCYLSVRAKEKLNNPSLNGSRQLFFETRCNVDGKDLVEVKDGDELNLFAEKIKIIETPGHSNCSICVKIGEVIFSGDTLFEGGFQGRTDLPTGSQREMEKSLKKLSGQYAGVKIYPGHGGAGTVF